MTPEARIVGVFVGAVENRWPEKPPSAIRKSAVEEPVEINFSGLVGDAQADLNVHGGLDKALHHYSADHYRSWRMELGREDLVPGGFGENISTSGWTEEAVCIGDIVALGSATVQISQGRQPCWKLNAYTENERMAWLFQKTGRTGWYYRVLAPGMVIQGDVATLIERPCREWSVRRVTAARLTRVVAIEEAKTLAELP
ncbi:MOSC domain-containing protein [Nitratireductor mangrovi]|uniref:MOSC domain-containing protein n=1 Tax=Nitratireductor mangrovi TaxID=2599600 RepID=UPI0019813F1D|nr:MOSC domain-containing protein [Nitratireductor mangrovi]